MNDRRIAGIAVAALLTAGIAIGDADRHRAIAQPAPAAGAPAAQFVIATPQVVREIQFMLLSLGIDPGPLDGNPRQLTNNAVRLFEERNGLPIADLVLGAPVPPRLIETLRTQVAQVLLRGPGTAAGPTPPAPAPPPAPEPTPTVAPAPAPAPPPAPEPVVVRPPAPPPDPYASCPQDPADFKVGGKQYTPQQFLEDGFGGSTARAVANLRQRLEEARQIAEKVGGAALLEVQRQARVLAYFECRLKIEQAAGTAK